MSELENLKEQLAYANAKYKKLKDNYTKLKNEPGYSLSLNLVDSEELKKLNEASEHLHKIFITLINFSKENGEYFYLCTIDVYESNYEDRLFKFMDSNLDADEIDFIEREEALIKRIKSGVYANPINSTKYILKKRRRFLDTKKLYIKNKIIETSSFKKQNQIRTIQIVYLLNKYGFIKTLREQGCTKTKISKIINVLVDRSPQSIRDILGYIDIPTKIPPKQALDIEKIKRHIKSL